MAYPVWSDVPARPGGQLRHLEMKHYNKNGYSFPGGPVSEPRARCAMEDVRTWRSGIKSAVLRKLDPDYVLN